MGARHCTILCFPHGSSGFTIQQVRKSALLIGAHGGSLANAVYARHGTGRGRCVCWDYIWQLADAHVRMIFFGPIFNGFKPTCSKFWKRDMLKKIAEPPPKSHNRLIVVQFRNKSTRKTKIMNWNTRKDCWDSPSPLVGWIWRGVLHDLTMVINR